MDSWKSRVCREVTVRKPQTGKLHLDSPQMCYFPTFEANLWLEEVLLIVSHHTLRLKGAFRLLESAPYPEQTDVVVLNTQEAGIKVDETRVPVCRSTTTSTAACDEILWNRTILVHEV
jgi:hypothetical protein